MNYQFIDQFKQIAQQNLSQLKIFDASTLISNTYSQNYQCLQKFIIQLLQYLKTYKHEIQTDRGDLSFRRPSYIKEPTNQQRINELLLENNRLAVEIKQLGAKLKEIEESQDVVKLKEQLNNLEKDKEEKINALIVINEQKDKSISKNNQLIVQLKSIIQKQDSQIQILNSYLENDKNKYKNIEDNYDRLEKDNKYLSEMTQMQYEDIINQQQRYYQNLKEESKSKKKLLEIQNEIYKMKIEKSKKVVIPLQDPEQNIRLTKLLQIFPKDKKYFKLMKELQLNNISKLSDQEQFTMLFLKNVKFDYIYRDSLNGYQYARPSFLIFYESNMKQLEQDYRNIDFHIVNLNYFSTIRAILDSQYNEFLFNQNIQNTIIKFPDFVYGWISVFEIDKITKLILKIQDKTQDHLESIRINFLLSCLSPKINKLQEIIMFNEFLFEQGSQDELYYYLHCRFLLFKGNLRNNSRSNFEVIIYVSLNWADYIITLLLWKIEEGLIQQIKQVIIESSVTKCNGTFVDGHYILKILLELYRTERRNRLAMIKEVFIACMTIQSNGKSGVTFNNFKKIFQSNFPTISDSEICALFRESYLCGDGIVTPESFFTAANENNLFQKIMLLKNIQKLPIIEQNQLAYKEQNLPYIDFYTHYKKLPHYLINQYCLQFGLQSIILELNSIYKQIDEYFQDQNQYYFDSLYKIISRLFTIYTTIIQMVFKQKNTFKQDWDQIEIESLKLFGEQLSQLFSPLIDYEQQDKLQMILKTQKIRPLQRTAKRKAQKFYFIIGNLINKQNISEQSPTKKKLIRQQSTKFQFS